MTLLTFHLGSFAALTLVLAPSLPAQSPWIPPTPDELSMTSLPQVPGAPAIYLFKEETTNDKERTYTFYSRIKILTEGGRDYANIELPFGGEAGISLHSISARTIHPDGTVIPFTGKPYDKVVEKFEGYKRKERVFTLPDVTVGSIIEYRYNFLYDDTYFLHPDWFIQSDLFVRKAHYLWSPTHAYGETIVDDKGNTLDRATWTPILPDGIKVEQKYFNGLPILELNISNVPPLPKEDFMPPLDSFSYRVRFYYTSYFSAAQYWTKEGEQWSAETDRFIGPHKGVKEAVNALAASSDSSDAKLRKIYNAVQSMENTHFSRERTTREDASSGLKSAQSTDDVLARKRGGADQLTLLFVAMARAAGFKAYVMNVADRSRHLFNGDYRSFDQFDDLVAIVNVDGTEKYFDPGQRYCSFGQLAWNHTITGGLRQLDRGATELSHTPAGFYRDSTTSRIADLILDEHGSASGTVKITYSGNSALYWRQEALRGDSTSLNADLRVDLEHKLPAGMDVKVTGIENLTDSSLPLKVSYQIVGSVGSSTGKRLLLPADLFEVQVKPLFPQARRELTIDMRYPNVMQDAIRFKLPAGVVLETAPTPKSDTLADVANFDIKVVNAPGSITVYRNLVIGKSYFTPQEYPDLRTFYNKLEAKDQESLVLTHAGSTAGSGTR